MKLIMMTIMVTMMSVMVAHGQKCQYNVGVLSGFSPDKLQGVYYEIYNSAPQGNLAYSKVNFTYESISQNMTMIRTDIYEKPTRGECINNTFILDASQAQNGVLILPSMWSNATHTGYANKIYVIYVDDKYSITYTAFTFNGVVIPFFNTTQVFSKDISLTYGELPIAAKAQVTAFCGSTFNPGTLTKMPLKTDILCTS